MLITIILLFYVLPTLNAPTWCFAFAWITFGFECFSVVGKTLVAIIKIMKERY